MSVRVFQAPIAPHRILAAAFPAVFEKFPVRLDREIWISAPGAVRTRVSRVAKWCVVKERRSSYKYDRDVVVGAECLHPESPINEVPSEYGVKNYRYTVVNNR